MAILRSYSFSDTRQRKWNILALDIMNVTIRAIIALVLGLVIIKLSLGALIKVQDESGHWLTPEELTTWKALFNGDLIFGNADYPVNWSDYAPQIMHTGIVVLLGLIWSTGISLLLGYKISRKPHAGLWDVIGNMTTLASGMPFFVVGLLLWTWLNYDLSEIIWPIFSDDIISFQDSGWNDLIKVVLGGLILGTCEGALSEGPRNFRTIFSDLRQKTYYLAYLARGQRTIGLVYRTIRPFLLQSLATRISYMFAAAVVVERALDINGLGLTFVMNITSGDRYAYRIAMISGAIILFIPLLIRVIIQIRLKFMEN